ncbi:MAG TPA: hypothetical protein VMB21_10675 [Candidatus Limnocylindria bacterium]|jgi:hypothetical protein|nr:hypothetical protein [Candidatus Limnocylindria bacterium]
MGITNLLALGRSVVGMGSKPAYRNARPGMLPTFGPAASGTGTGTSDPSLFAAPQTPEMPGTVNPAAPVANAPAATQPRPFAALPFLKPKRSWFGWLFGGNRRRTDGRLVQGEFRLQNVRPVQNTLRDDDSLTVVERPRAKVLYETPVVATPQHDQNHAWNRLRGRKLENLVVKPD